MLLTIVPDTKAARQTVYGRASEFLSALSWEFRSGIKMWDCGGRGWPGSIPLWRAKRCMFEPTAIPYSATIGYYPVRLPAIETDEQRIAMTLLREARGSNDDYTSFIFFWQIMETAGTNAIGWVNKTLRKHRDRIAVSNDQLDFLAVKDKTLGDFLSDDCRHAIAHICRKPGKKKLLLDTAEEKHHISVAGDVAEAFATFYIFNELGLTKQLHLARKAKRAVPSYVSEDELKEGVYEIIYDR